MLIALASVFGFRLFSTDVTQAYLQSADKLMSDVYIKPSTEFELGPDQIQKLLKPLYGLVGIGDFWGKTLSEYFQKDLSKENVVGDEALLLNLMKGSLQGLCATYADDIPQAGNEDFYYDTRSIERKFQYKAREFDNIHFAGLHVETCENCFELHQRTYISKLQLPPNPCDFKAFRSLRAMLSWVVNTRLDIVCRIEISAQVTEIMFKGEMDKAIRALNAIIRHLRRTPQLTIKFPKLDKSWLRIQVCSDAAYSNNYNRSSQLGFIIFLADKENRCQPISTVITQVQRATRSVLGSEKIAFTDSFDVVSRTSLKKP